MRAILFVPICWMHFGVCSKRKIIWIYTLNHRRRLLFEVELRMKHFHSVHLHATVTVERSRFNKVTPNIYAKLLYISRLLLPILSLRCGMSNAIYNICIVQSMGCSFSRVHFSKRDVGVCKDVGVQLHVYYGVVIFGVITARSSLP